jgi:hypothetical protein
MLAQFSRCAFLERDNPNDPMSNNHVSPEYSLLIKTNRSTVYLNGGERPVLDVELKQNGKSVLEPEKILKDLTYTFLVNELQAIDQPVLIDNSGLINPLTAGSIQITAHYKNGTTRVQSNSLLLQVDESEAMLIEPNKGILNINSSLQFTVTGGIAPYQFTVTTGSSTGTITKNGLYTSPAGAISAVIQVEDSTCQKNFAIITTIEAASSPTWAGTQQYHLADIHATWNPSGSEYLDSQEIYVYESENCQELVHSEILGSNISSYTFPSPPAGSYSFRIASNYSINESPLLSSCSESISLIDFSSLCPAGYVRIEANPDVGTTDDFCLAAYEMKCTSDASGLSCSASDLPQSTASG